MWNVVNDTIIYAKETNANEVQGKLNEDSWIALQWWNANNMVANPAKLQLKCPRKFSCKHKCLMARKYTAKKMKLSIPDFFSKYDQI